MTVEEAKNRVITFSGNVMLAEAVVTLVQALLDNHVPKPRCRCYTVDSGLRY